LRRTGQAGRAVYLFQVRDRACTTAPKGVGLTAVHTGLHMHVGMAHALFASTQTDGVEDGGKSGGNKEAGTEMVRAFQCHKIIFIENNPVFSCWYSRTNRPSAFCPLTEHLHDGDKSVASELASGTSGPGRECARGSTALRRRVCEDGGSSMAFGQR